MKVSIRAFIREDIPYKVRWINDPRNNTYLHYELPLEIEKTEMWFDSNIGRTDRYDATIICNGEPVGLIGLLSISAGRAEYYVTMGECEYKGRGIAKAASMQLFKYAKEELKLNTIDLFTEVENIGAQKLFESIGFVKQEICKASAVNRGELVDRFYYTLNL